MTPEDNSIRNETNDLKIPLIEKIKSIPEIFGIRTNEEPAYKILKKNNNIEIHKYSKQLLSQITFKKSNFDDFREEAFKILATYIFGGNKSHTQMAMTSPVLEEKSSQEQWTMSFIHQSKYNMTNVPTPINSHVKLEEIAGFDAAIIRYNGNNTIEKVKFQEQLLEQWLVKNPQFKTKGNFFIAQYDAPFVLPFFKRNEIFIKVSNFQ